MVYEACITEATFFEIGIQLFQLTLSEEKQKAYEARLQDNMGFL